MSVAMIWGSPGSGKTVAATAPKNEKILLLCSDNSAVVLNMFERKNVTERDRRYGTDKFRGGSSVSPFLHSVFIENKIGIGVCI